MRSLESTLNAKMSRVQTCVLLKGFLEIETPQGRMNAGRKGTLVTCALDIHGAKNCLA